MKKKENFEMSFWLQFKKNGSKIKKKVKKKK